MSGGCAYGRQYRKCCLFFNDTATTEIYTLSLHDALPILLLIPAIDLKDGHCVRLKQGAMDQATTFSEDPAAMARNWLSKGARQDRKSTRLNSSHANISYAVFCLKKNLHLHRLLHAATLYI